MAMIKCPECGKKISDKSPVCVYCGCPIEQNATERIEEVQTVSASEQDAVLKDDNSATSTARKFIKTHKAAIIVVCIIILSLIIGLSVGIPVGVKNKRETMYKELKYEMMHFDYASEGLIEHYLDELPLDYRNVETISQQFEIVKKCTLPLTIYKRTILNCDRARHAYINLLTLSNTSASWDFTSYLDENIADIIFGIEWLSDSGNWYEKIKLYWYEENDEEWFRCGLPNNKKSDREYYFYSTFENKSVIFGYEDKKSGEKFDAYKVQSLTYKDGEFQIQVYCYSDKSTYHLTAEFS